MTKAQLAWGLGFVAGWVIVSLGWETDQFCAANTAGMLVGLAGFLWFGMGGGPR